MAIADRTILEELQRVTIEAAGDGGVSWPSGMWTMAEVLGYLNQRQNRWLGATSLLWTHALTPVVANQARQAAPSNWTATIFMAFCDLNGCFRELPKVDTHELDLRYVGWPLTSSDRPYGYYETEGETLSTYLAPIPSAAITQLEWYYVALGAALTQTPSITFTVPDEFVPTIKYGALADMFSKVGPAANPILAAACEERWTEGLEMGKLMATEGWLAL